MTTFMTYKEECEALRQCVAELEKERDRLSELCDKWHSECDDMREANNHLANVADALKQQRDELLEALEDAVSVVKDALDHWDQDRDMKVGKLLHALSGLVKGYDRRADAVHNAIASVKEK